MDLSVICPIYNNTETMLPMIASFQQQDIGDYDVEYIFICNGCKDDSEGMLKKFKKMFPKTFKHCKILTGDFSDTGLARQMGVENSTGKYIMFCDMDDWLLDREAFKKVLQVAEEHPNKLIKFGFDLPKKDYFYLEDGKTGFLTYWRIKNKMTCTVWRYAFPRFIFNDCKFRGELSGKDDIDLMNQIIELHRETLKMVTIPEDFYFWNYMDPRSYSYKEFMKKKILTKNQFLELTKNTTDASLKEVIEHLL